MHKINRHANNGSRAARIAGGCLALLLVVPVVAAAADERLVDAAARQDADALKLLLDAGADANTRRADGATALLWATHWTTGRPSACCSGPAPT